MLDRMQDYEKLGAFYLGRRYDPDRAKTTDENILYDSKDLTTHVWVPWRVDRQGVATPDHDSAR
jgi:hypothetical protein